MAHYDLVERTLKFSQNIRSFAKRVKISIVNRSDIGQVIRSSGSVGANYIEANEALGKKDFKFRAKIAKKEAKESRYWLACLENNIQPELDSERKNLHQEATELMKILAAIIRNSGD